MTKVPAPPGTPTADHASYNDRPKHRHSCPGKGDKGKQHEWDCTSAYCNQVNRRCPDCGGNQPFVDE